MRKIISGILIVALLMMPAPVFAAATPHDVHVQANDEVITFPDARPFKDEQQRVQVPIRFLSETLGYNVEWAKNEKVFSVVLTKDELTILLQTGSNKVLVNGTEHEMDTVPMVRDDRVYAPLRFLSELSGLVVTWDADNALAIVHGPDEQPVSAITAPKWKLISEMTATAYTAPKNKKGEYEARTYTGTVVGLGAIAVDPDVIPLGSTLYIEGYDFNGLPEGGMLGKAVDIGGAVKGNKIDIFVPVPRSEALKFGFQTVNVYVLQE